MLLFVHCVMHGSSHAVSGCVSSRAGHGPPGPICCLHSTLTDQRSPPPLSSLVLLQAEKLFALLDPIGSARHELIKDAAGIASMLPHGSAPRTFLAPAPGPPAATSAGSAPHKEQHATPHTSTSTHGIRCTAQACQHRWHGCCGGERTASRLNLCLGDMRVCLHVKVIRGVMLVQMPHRRPHSNFFQLLSISTCNLYDWHSHGSSCFCGCQFI